MTFVASLATALAIATALAVALAIVLASLHAVLEIPSVRRGRAHRGARITRRRRRERDEMRLEQADASIGAYSDLADVVEQLATSDERAAAELESLLERYVEVALARRSCRAALDQGDLARLELQLAIASECHPHETDLLEHRVAQSRRFAERLQHFDDSLATLGDLVRYYAERASLPEVEPLLEGHVIDTALAADG